MTKLEFDEPSRIEINSNKDALEIINNGISAAIAGKAANHNGVYGWSTTSNGIKGESTTGDAIFGTDLFYIFKRNIFINGDIIRVTLAHFFHILLGITANEE